MCHEIFEIGTDVQTPDGPGEVIFVTRPASPKMGYTVQLYLAGEHGYANVHYHHSEVRAHESTT